MSYIQKLIDAGRSYYEQHEKEAFDRARMYYRGEFAGALLRSTDGSADASRSLRKYLCTMNLVYAIADSALSSLIGPNPQVSANPLNLTSQEVAPAVDGLMRWIFRKNSMRRRAATTLIDAVLTGRGIFKTGWDADRDMPIIRAIDPSRLFFDRSVRDVDEIRYWLEATVIPMKEFKARVDSGKYVITKDVQADSYPTWMLDVASQSSRESLQSARRWVTVWEYYDLDAGMVSHYVEQTQEVVLSDKLVYVPYSMYSLSQSGVDAGGLSEVKLILSQQETINDLLTLQKRVAYLQIPRILYDAGLIREKDLAAAVESAVGSYVPVHLNADVGQRPERFDNLFSQLRLPENPPQVDIFIEKMKDIATFVSALADYARGQITNASTATEVAVIDAQMKTRLSTREGHLQAAIEDVADKALFLCRRYMQMPKLVRVTGARGFSEVTLDTLRHADVEFEMVAYNPIRQNPSVQIETLQSVLPILMSAPNVDTNRLIRHLVHGLGLPNDIIIPDSEAAMRQAALSQAEMVNKLGGAAAPILAAAAIPTTGGGGEAPTSTGGGGGAPTSTGGGGEAAVPTPTEASTSAGGGMV